jgi:Phage integrase, N-terminal SAM-like domain
MGPAEVEAFLNDLVVNHRVAALTQSQALNAIVFLYDSVPDPWARWRASSAYSVDSECRWS